MSTPSQTSESTSSQKESERDSGRYAAFLARAKRDLDEVLVEANPAIQVFPQESEDGLKMCLIFTPYGGKWNGFRLHFNVELELRGKTPWPVYPPKVIPDPSFEHPLFPRDKGYQFPMYSGYFMSMIDEEDTQRMWREKYKPSHTLSFLFHNLLHLLSACNVQSGNPHQGYTTRTDESSLVTLYLTETEYAFLRIPIEEAYITQACWRGRRKFKQAWSSDTRPEIRLMDYQASPTSTKTVHSVKSSEPESGRIHKVQKRTATWYSLLKDLSKTKCNLCLYGSPQVPHVASIPTPIPNEAAPLPSSWTPLFRPVSCKLGILLDDNLTDVAKWLEPSSIRAFAAAYPRFNRVMHHFQILQVRALRCSLLRTSQIDSGILGVKILDFQFWKPDVVDHAPKWLSLVGFEAHSISIETTFEPDPWSWPDDNPPTRHEHPTLFLPMAMSLEHFNHHREEIMRRLDMLHDALYADAQVPEFARQQCGFCDETHEVEHKFYFDDLKVPTRPLRHLRLIVHWMTLIMDRMVADRWHLFVTGTYECDDPMTQKSLTEETDTAAAWYCQLLHLALTICRDNPEILHEAKAFVHDVLKDTEVPRNGCHYERNAYTMDHEGIALGLLTIISILEPTTTSITSKPRIEWSTVNGPFLHKFFVGCAKWYLGEKDFKVLKVMESGANDFRLVKTFHAMQKQLLRFMVRTAFLQGFTETYASKVSMLDDNCGFIDAKLTERLLKDIKASVRVRTWPGFFRQVGWSRGERMGKDAFCEVLRGTVNEVMAYWFGDAEKPAWKEACEELKASRQEAEDRWEEDRRIRRGQL